MSIAQKFPFIQTYVNIKKKIRSYTLVVDDNRLYGRNCYFGKWHMHPEGQPDIHEVSEEGRRHIGFEEFLFEVEEILIKRKLI